MGADLIGYFAKGPRDLPQDKVPLAIAEVDRRLAWLRRAAPFVEKEDYSGLVGLLADCPWIPGDQGPYNEAEIETEQLGYDIGDLLSAAGNIDDLTGAIWVKDFIDKWPLGCPDAAFIGDPDNPSKLMVFAGESTWGDAPGGEGYRLLAQADAFGICSFLGVWIGDALGSITISRKSTEENP